MEYDRNLTVYDYLMSQTKGYIDDLRRLLDADVRSNLKKADMAKELAEEIKYEGEYWLRKFPSREIEIVHEILSRPKGKFTTYRIQPYSTLLEMFGLIHSEYNASGEVRFAVTDEMYDAFKRALPNTDASRYCMEYDQYERYLRGALNLYGVAPFALVFDIIVQAGEKIENKEEDSLSYHRNPFSFLHDCLVMEFYSFEYEGVKYVFHPSINNPEQVHKEQRLRREKLINYKSFTLDQIYAAAGEDDFSFVGKETDEGRAVDRYFLKKDMPQDARDKAGYLLWRLGQEEGGTGIARVLEMAGGGFDDVNDLRSFMSAVMEYHNTISKWALMGRSSREVGEGRYPVPLTGMTVSKNKFKS